MGGGTVVNWTTCLRPPEAVLKEWETEFGVDGLLGADFNRDIEAVWERLRVNENESRHNPNNLVIKMGCDALGYREGEDYEVIQRNGVECKGRCGPCGFGCSYSAKQSTLMNFLPEASLYGAKIIVNCKGEKLMIGEGRVQGMEALFQDADTSFHFKIRSRIVVAACGAVETPALMLRYKIPNRWIGKGLHLQPCSAIVAIHDRPIKSWEGPPQTIVVKGDRRRAGGHFRLEAVPCHPGMIALGIPWYSGMAHKNIMRQAAYLATTLVLIKDRGTGSVALDAQGNAVVSYSMIKADRENLIEGLKEAARIHWKAGANRIFSLHSKECSLQKVNGGISASRFEAFGRKLGKLGVHPNAINLYSAHLISSCRMGARRDQSVFNPEGESHDVKNLFIGDGSALPTAPGVNPMVTIMAVARRTSRYIKNRLDSHPIL